jgi:hypothetical protein
VKRLPFAHRLAAARQMIARGAAGVPGHLADQFAAATGETRQITDRLGVLMPVLQPDRHWRQRVEAQPSDDVRAYLLAGLLACGDVCPHLRRGGPQPAVVCLALGRTDCTRCVGTLRRPSAEDDDRCDVCGRRGVVTFVPFAMRSGPLLVAGDACADCASVLGIAQEMAS